MLSDCPPTLLFHSRVSRRKRHHCGYRTLAVRKLWWTATSYAPETSSGQTRTSIFRPRLGCGDGHTDNQGGPCDRTPKWGLGRTLANTDRDATADPVNTTFLRDVQPPALKRHTGPRHADSSHQNPGGGSGSANRTQVTGSRGRDPMAPNLNVPTDTGQYHALASNSDGCHEH